MFGAESDIPPFCLPGGALVSDLAGKAELLSTWFDRKQSRDIVELPQTCHPRPAFCGIAFRAHEVERHLLDLDPNGGVDPSGCFPMFFWKTTSVLAPKLNRLFHRLLRCGEFPLEWQIADVTDSDFNSQRSLICACLQLLADFDYTSSVKDFWEVDLFAFWSLLVFGEIWGLVISPVLIQKEFGYLWCSSRHYLCWSVGIWQRWRACARSDWFQCGLWQG